MNRFDPRIYLFTLGHFSVDWAQGAIPALLPYFIATCGWSYQDDKGDWYHTKGKKPNRTLQRAFENTKGKIINRAKQIFKEGLG